MSFAWLSPLPPVRSGVAEYATDLLPHLAPLLPLRIFAAAPASGEISGLKVEPPKAFDAGDFELPIYHMGNNLHHRFVHERAIRRPGLLVLHDLVLHHFYVEEMLARGQRDEYVRFFGELYGESGAAVGYARAYGVWSELTCFVFPMFERLAAASRAVVVHNQRAEGLVKSRVEGVRVAVVPMGIPGPEQDRLPPAAEARAALGIAEGETVVALFGFLTPVKRPIQAMRAFARALPRMDTARLVLVGEPGGGLDLVGEARALGIAGLVTIAGYVAYAEAKRWMAAADVCLNLRYPTAGETSASLLRLLGWGKAVIVSEYGQFREIPEAAAARVSVGASEEAEIAELLVLLAGSPGLRASLGAAAARHVAVEHALPLSARRYAEVAREVAAQGVGAAGRVVAVQSGRTSRNPQRPAARIEAEPIATEHSCPGELRLRVRLRNTGDTTWLRGPFPEGGHVVLGAFLGGRPAGGAALPADVAPGEEAVVEARVRLPATAGAVDLVLDVVIEGWGRLGERGSEVAHYHLNLVPA